MHFSSNLELINFLHRTYTELSITANTLLWLYKGHFQNIRSYSISVNLHLLRDEGYSAGFKETPSQAATDAATSHAVIEHNHSGISKVGKDH